MGHILIVDDEWMNRELLQAFLTMGGHTVTEVNSGEKALNWLNNELPDVILLDIRMPGMSGFEVCMQLKNDERTSAIPILMVSALESDEDQLQAKQMGADGFITKPFDSAAILAKIDALL